MNSKVEALEDNQLEISIEVPAADVDAQIKRTYKDFARRYSFPGFRRGKAPRPVIDNMLGKDAVLVQVTEDLVNSTYPAALDEHNLIPLFKAEFSDAMVEEHKDFAFTAKITVKPAVELSSYEPVEIELPTTEASEDEITAGIDEFRNYYMEYKDCNANTKVKKDQFVEISMTVTDPQGEEVSALACETRLYQLNQNLYPEAFDAELIGMKRGEEKSFDLDLTGMSSMLTSNLDLAEGVYRFDVKIDSIKKQVLPEANDDFAKNLGFDDLASLRELVAEQIKSQKEVSEDRRKENECLFTLAERYDGELPQSMCEVEETNLLQELFRQLQQAGTTYDAFLKQSGLKPDELKEDVKKQAADTVRQDLALDAWAEHAGIEVTPEDITAEFEKAQVDDAAAVEKQWRDSGRIPMIVEGIKRTKALANLVETAKVTVVENEPAAAADEAEAEATEAEAETAPEAE